MQMMDLRSIKNPNLSDDREEEQLENQCNNENDTIEVQ